MAIRSWTIPIGAVLLAAALSACAPETDRERYEVGESGVVTFRNAMRKTALPGRLRPLRLRAAHRRRVGLAGTATRVCVWEGFAEPVAPAGVVTDPIHARAPGTWRLRYPVGFGCSESAPLGDGHCARIVETHQQRVRSVRRGLRGGRLLGPALRRRAAGQHLRVAPALRVLPRRPLRPLRAGGLLWLGGVGRTRCVPGSPGRRRRRGRSGRDAELTALPTPPARAAPPSARA